ncbi:AraC family transcriptional regulator [Hydrogenispora ethanolica]|uniref:AraC family transcriptional regulator n=1 Tax=Hydrogenispora ethanolica TaxID=1082276 RepID=A0A4R1QSK8_HYDET|nr:AraC family transcriptional regulator [Hydrogenispora ethanolica]TCL56023.1 AraC family transcriptional regulator [Hydrogenispora ethanolica]
MGNDLIIDENMYGHALGKNETSPLHIEHYFFKENGTIFPPHWHEQFMLMYVKKGMLLLQCGKQKILAEQDSIAIVNPNEIHSGENPESDLEYYSLKIDLLLLLGNQPDLQQTMYTELLLKNRVRFENKISNDDFLLGCMKHIIKEFGEKKEGYELALRGLGYQILTALLRKFTKTVADQSELDMQYRRLKQIKPAITYMESHLADKITLKKLSEVTHLSPIHFSRVFKTVSGFSPMEFLGRMRIQKASQLLVNTDKTIVEIAMDTGFNDGNYFSRFFKKCRKETPREFREKYVKK